jgi:predicted nucleotidyltransferase
MNHLGELVAKFERAFSGRLVSVILYGSAASGEHHEKFSDLNVLCVVKEITPRELAESEPVLKWWRELGHPSPLLMSEEEVYNSADSFPIEFGDMKRSRRVLFGVDVIADLVVHPTHYRAYVERELRSSLFRLRQQGAQTLSSPASLLKVCVASVPTFCILGRHALLLAGQDAPPDRRAVIHKLAQIIHMDVRPFDVFLDVREEKPGVEAPNVIELFALYLDGIRKIVEFVNGLEEKHLEAKR